MKGKDQTGKLGMCGKEEGGGQNLFDLNASQLYEVVAAVVGGCVLKSVDCEFVQICAFALETFGTLAPD